MTWLQPLYVMELDQANLTKAKETIQKVMEGKEKWLISTRTSSLSGWWTKDKREDTRALLRKKLSPRGADHILSHSRRKGDVWNSREEKIYENFQEVKKIAAEVTPDLTIHCGARSTLLMMSWKTGRTDHSTFSWDALHWLNSVWERLTRVHTAWTVCSI